MAVVQTCVPAAVGAIAILPAVAPGTILPKLRSVFLVIVSAVMMVDLAFAEAELVAACADDVPRPRAAHAQPITRYDEALFRIDLSQLIVISPIPSWYFKKPAAARAPAGFDYSLTGESLLIRNRDGERAGVRTGGLRRTDGERTTNVEHVCRCAGEDHLVGDQRVAERCSHAVGT